MSSTQSPLLDRDSFQAWKDSPLTRAFLQYLKDRRTSLMEAWAEGRTSSAEHQAQAVVLGRLAQIEFEDVAEQYAPDEPVEDAAAVAERLKEESGR